MIFQIIFQIAKMYQYVGYYYNGILNILGYHYNHYNGISKKKQ